MKQKIKRHSLLALLIAATGMFACSNNSGTIQEHKAQRDVIIKRGYSKLLSGDYPGTLAFFDSAFGAIKNPGPGDLADRFSFRSHVYTFYDVDYRKAMQQNDSIIELLKNTEATAAYRRQLANAYINKGDIFFRMGSFREAYEAFFQGKKLAVLSNEETILGEYSDRLSKVCYRQGKYEEAIRFERESYAHFYNSGKSVGSYIRLQELLDNIGLYHFKLGRTDSALHYYQQALDFINSNKGFYPAEAGFTETAVAVVYGNMSEVYALKGDTLKAEDLLLKGIKINFKKGREMYDAQSSLTKLARLYLQENRLSDARSILEKLDRSFDLLRNDQAKMRSFRLKSSYFYQLGDTVTAYKFQSEYIKLKDSLDALEKHLTAADFTSEYKKIEQENEISDLKDKDEKKNLMLRIGFVVLAMGLAIILLGYKYWMQSKQNVLKLTLLNRRISGQNISLNNTLNSLELSRQDNTRLLKIVAHDLRNPIGAICTAADLLLSDTENLKPDSVELLEMIKGSGANSLQLIAELLQGKTESKNLQKEPADMQEILRYCVDLIRFKAEEKKQHIVLEAESAEVLVNREKMWRVFSNLITNAVKFSPPGAEILVRLVTKPGSVLVQVQDPGIGIPDNLKASVFDIFSQAGRAGTAGEESFGMGLAICKQIVEAHQGRIWFESEPGKKTIFFVQLPLQPD